MERALRPERLTLDVKLSSDGRNEKEYKHWKFTMTSYIAQLSAAATTAGTPLTEENKLTILANHISSEVYSSISGATQYTPAIAILDGLFIRTNNKNFARFKLFSKKQHDGESIVQYKLALLELAKHCEFEAVDAVTHEEECMRTAFISGIKSDTIRQRLLEATQTLTNTLQLAETLETAENNSKLYHDQGQLLNAIPSASSKSFKPGQNGPTRNSCGNCGNPRHSQGQRCPARESKCNSCGRRGHWANVCRSKPKNTLNAIPTAHDGASQFQPRGEYNPLSPPIPESLYSPGIEDGFQSISPYLASTHVRSPNLVAPCAPAYSRSFDPYRRASYPPSYPQRSTLPSHADPHCASASSSSYPPALSDSVIRAKVNDKLVAFTLVDTGSSLSFISNSFATIHGLAKIPCSTVITMASDNHSSAALGMCPVQLQIGDLDLGHCKLLILENLCCDIIIGHDILANHDSLVMKFRGCKPPIRIGPDSTSHERLAMAVSKIVPPPLFSNLSPDIRPIACGSRRYSDTGIQFIRKTTDELLKNGMIRHSNSPWRAQVLVVDLDKPHSRPRMVVDYSRTINKYTELDAYPLPLIDSQVSKIAQYSIYSTFDLKSAYYQVPILESEKHFTAFEANGQLFEFNVIPFGVTNGVAAFQRVIDQIIREENLEATFAYLDNITVAGLSQSELDCNVKLFLSTCEKYGLTLNDSKTISSVRTLNILGYSVSHNCIRPDPERMKPLLDLPLPTDQPALKRALGFFSYYSRWVERFSDRVHLLVDSPSFPLSVEAAAAFEELKQHIAKSIIVCPNTTDPLVLESDASDFALSATLSQGGKPVAFFSRSLKPHERKHPSVEKEACAIVESCRKWFHYLAGRKFSLITDQQAVSFMFDQRNHGKLKNDKLLRWRIELQTLDFEIKYRPGPENLAADCLSRVRCAATSSIQGLSKLHNDLVHPGIVRLYHYVRTNNLPYSLGDVKSIASQCRVCAEVKPQFFKPQNPPLIEATKAFDRLSVDFKGPLPSNSRNRYLFTVVDEYSRFPWAFPCSDMESSTAIKCLAELFDTYGSAGYVHSDRGPGLRSQEFRAFLRSRSVAFSNSAKYNPRGNGQCERYNGVIWKGIELALRSRNLPVTHWELVRSHVLDCQRSLLCTATNSTPHQRFMSFERRSIRENTLPSWLTENGPVLVRRHVRRSKYEPLVSEVELVSVNPTNAKVKYPCGREDTVSLRDLAPLPKPSQPNSSTDSNLPSGPVLRVEGTPGAEESRLLSDDRLRSPPVTEFQPPPVTFTELPISAPNPVQLSAPPSSEDNIRRSTRTSKPPERFQAGVG